MGIWGMYACQCGDIKRDIGFSVSIFLFKGSELNGFVEEVRYGLIEDYSPRLLTIPEDRLPAFSGLAKNFADTFVTLSKNHRASKMSAFVETISSGKHQEYGVSVEERYKRVSGGIYIPPDPGDDLAGLWSNYLDTGRLWSRPLFNHPLISKIT
jgi:hypothetical protein